MQTQNNMPMCYQRGNQRTRQKPLRRPPSDNWSNRQSVGIHGLARDPPSLIYPMHLSPPSSYSNKASRNRVLSSSPDPVICPIASAKAWLLPMFLSNTKASLNTLKGCGKCLGYQPLNGMEMERQELRKIHKQFVQKIVGITISNSQGLQLGFFLRSTTQHLWVMWV